MIVAAREGESSKAFRGNLVGRGHLHALDKALAGIRVQRINAIHSSNKGIARDPDAWTARTINGATSAATTVWINKRGPPTSCILRQRQVRKIIPIQNQVPGKELVPVHRHNEPWKKAGTPDNAGGIRIGFLRFEGGVSADPSIWWYANRRRRRNRIKKNRKDSSDWSEQLIERRRPDRLPPGSAQHQVRDYLITK